MPKTIVVTGASSGVGRATARAFAARGDRVALLARGRAGLDGAARDVADAGGTAHAVPVDVTDPDGLEKAAEEVEGALGPIDVWVNDAMVTVLSAFADMEPDEYRRVTEVTYLGSVYGAMTALRRMRERGSGVIVQVGSALAFRGIPLQSAYCGAKHALEGWYESLRVELRAEHTPVKVTMVQLPAVNTPQFSHCRTRLDAHPQPVPPIYQPEVCADAIVWASEHPRRQIYVGDSTVATIYGQRAWPAFMQRYLARTGIDGQQADRPYDADRPDNLFAPTDAEHDEGAHGVFDDRARGFSPQLFLTERRRALGAWGLAAAAVGAAGLLARRA